MGCLRVWLRKNDLEKGLRAAQAPALGTSAEGLSTGGENAPHSDYQQAGRNHNVYHSGNPNHQIFMLHLCSVPFSVWTLKSLEEKLFYGGFVIILFLFTIVPTEHHQIHQTRLANPANVPEAHVSQKSWELPTFYEVNFYHLESTNLNWNILSLLIC